jgi:hypothetical protein
MPTGNALATPFPLSSFPGANPQEGAGRLINCYAEPLGEGGKGAIAPNVWRRSPGLSLFARGSASGYRGGMIANNLAYEAWAGTAATIDAAGNETILGSFPGTSPISIAHNQVSPTPDVVAVDPNQGAYVLSGGGAPTPYTGGGSMPQPNSVCFQDGYLFFSIGDGRVFATDINVLTMNALSFVTIASRSDVTLLRVIAYSGLLFCFTTASLEIWQDTAQPSPGFPYSRSLVLDVGLKQASAIAGFETGFAELLWVDQDAGVRYMAPSSNAPPQKVSPPDLDKLIQKQIDNGAMLEAGCYFSAGHKFWTLSSPDWTWEFNIDTSRWNERTSLLPTGIYGRWRGKFGHPAFDKFILGDAQSGNLVVIDNNNYTEVGTPQLFRIESGPIANFPAAMRVARADFLFDMGVGQVVQHFVMNVTGAALGTGGVVRLAVNDTSQARTGDTVTVAGVGGTTEANGTWPMTLIDATHIELVGSAFANAYTSGGSAIDVTAPPQMVDPRAAVSWSLDGGLTFGNPLIRSLGQQGRTKRSRVSVKNLGLALALGVRFRLDVTDPVYTGLLSGTVSADPQEVGP